MATTIVTPTAVSSPPTLTPATGETEQLWRRRAAVKRAVAFTRRERHGRLSDRHRRPSPQANGRSGPSAFGVRVRRALDVRALRLRVFLLLAVLLLPLVLITTFAES
ncbi:hypothetical protein [Micromonospora chalcea]|uniref:hypothetical protein n=1 Tax=Micromonospora chalcea TaxID=1874 RepID=UPI0011B08CB0|nr:hypothetical protein [Micromonospora chalcea]